MVFLFSSNKKPPASADGRKGGSRIWAGVA
jgi:hypothetical protein